MLKETDIVGKLMGLSLIHISFLAIDGVLDLYMNVVDGLVVYPKVIEQRLMSELPFMATENIMMDAVKRGGDRQELHERIREHSMEAGRMVDVYKRQVLRIV